MTRYFGILTYCAAVAVVTFAFDDAPRVMVQDPGGTPAFEVASVKRNVSGDSRMSAGREGGRYSAVNAPLRFLILTALNLGAQPYRLMGGPDWIDSARFDIIAALPTDASPGNTTRMLRTLLEERFALRLHVEKREMPIYALVRLRDDGNLGRRMSPSTTDCDTLVGSRGSGAQLPSRADGGPTCGFLASNRMIRAGGRSISSLATLLPQHVGRHVEDRTGLKGAFDFDLEFAAEDGRGPRTDVDAGDRPSIFTALQEQLGLRLESAQGTLEVFIIDDVQHPAEK